MIDRSKNALRRAVGIRILEERLNGIQAILSSTDGKVALLQSSLTELGHRVAELELHNAGMHAAMTNLMLRNEALLVEIERTLRHQSRSIEQQVSDRPVSGACTGAQEARSTE